MIKSIGLDYRFLFDLSPRYPDDLSPRLRPARNAAQAQGRGGALVGRRLGLGLIAAFSTAHPLDTVFSY
jgi:hypothetical protein